MGRKLLWMAMMLLAWSGSLQAQEMTVFLSSNNVTDVAAGGDAVVWSSDGGAMGFRPGDSTYISLTTAGALSTNHLTAVAIDSTGSVWYGTDEDGVQWVDGSGGWHIINTYSGLPSNEITSLDAWGDGVWIGTTGGAAYFVGDTRVETVSSGGGLPAGAVRSVWVEGPDRIWFASDGGLALRTAKGWELHFPGLGVRALSLDRHGALWAAVATALYRWDDPVWTIANVGLPDPHVYALVLADTVLWAGSEDGPAWYDDAAGGWVSERTGIGQVAVTGFGYNGEVGLWVGTESEGVAWWNGTTWEPRFPSSPATNYAADLAVDPDGGLWCATGADNNVFSLPEGGAKGVMHFDGEEWVAYRKTTSPLPRDNVYRIAADLRGHIWIGTWGSGLAHFAPRTGVWDTLSIASGDLFANHISALVAGPRGEIWCTEYIYPQGGIAVVDSFGVVTHFGQSEGLPTVYFRSLAVDSLGRVWGGAWGLEGSTDLPTLSRLDTRGTFADKGDDELIIYSATQWGGSVPIHALAAAPDGGVWIGVEGGIAWTDGTEWDPVSEACAGSVTGQVRAVAVDRSGAVWFATARGLGEWRDGIWTNHGTAGGGLASDEALSLAYDWVRHTLWIGTPDGGMSRWAFEPPEPTTPEPEVYAYPNPFRPVEGHEFVTLHGLSESSEIKIMTLDGQDVVTIPPGVFQWDGRTAGGRNVASGLYIYAGEDEGGRARLGKVAVIR